MQPTAMKKEPTFFHVSEQSNNEVLEATSDVTVEPRDFVEFKEEQIWTKDTNNPFTLENLKRSKFLTAKENGSPEKNIEIDGNYEQSDSLQSVCGGHGRNESRQSSNTMKAYANG